uniref:Uncharacterized protein n=1 Tax=Siphoviridae sp. ctGMq5 TaxID=2826220 RepID=A0A8S5NMC5_9CAUD|nr:MAG TPA: hypothetical protein [Siphoviridae sp. ctGMq5]
MLMLRDCYAFCYILCKLKKAPEGNPQEPVSTYIIVS